MSTTTRASITAALRRRLLPSSRTSRSVGDGGTARLISGIRFGKYAGTSSGSRSGARSGAGSGARVIATAAATECRSSTSILRSSSAIVLRSGASASSTAVCAMAFAFGGGDETGGNDGSFGGSGGRMEPGIDANEARVGTGGMDDTVERAGMDDGRGGGDDSRFGGGALESLTLGMDARVPLSCAGGDVCGSCGVVFCISPPGFALLRWSADAPCDALKNESKNQAPALARGGYDVAR